MSGSNNNKSKEEEKNLNEEEDKMGGRDSRYATDRINKRGRN